MVVGPQCLHLVGDAEQKMGIAELGITLLLFLVGLELEPARLWRMRRDIFVLGLLQVTACGLVLAAVLHFTTGFSNAAALALGLPLALSSTAQVLPMLQSSGRMKTRFGERAFAVLLFQDLSIIPLITIVAALSRNPADAGGPPGWLMAVETAGAIVALVLAGRFLLRPLFRVIGNLGEREMFVVASLFTVLAAAALMQSLGLSSALGAFIAGVMLAGTPYRHELEAAVEPFRSILLGLFFLSVGMMLDLSAIVQEPLFVLAVTLLLIVTKAAVIFGLALLFRMNWRGALALGLLLSQGGEFAFVLFTQATRAQLIARLDLLDRCRLRIVEFHRVRRVSPQDRRLRRVNHRRFCHARHRRPRNRNRSRCRIHRLHQPAHSTLLPVAQVLLFLGIHISALHRHDSQRRNRFRIVGRSAAHDNSIAHLQIGNVNRRRRPQISLARRHLHHSRRVGHVHRHVRPRIERQRQHVPVDRLHRSHALRHCRLRATSGLSRRRSLLRHRRRNPENNQACSKNHTSIISVHHARLLFITAYIQPHIPHNQPAQTDYSLFAAPT